MCSPLVPNQNFFQIIQTTRTFLEVLVLANKTRIHVCDLFTSILQTEAMVVRKIALQKTIISAIENVLV